MLLRLLTILYTSVDEPFFDKSIVDNLRCPKPTSLSLEQYSPESSQPRYFIKSNHSLIHFFSLIGFKEATPIIPHIFAN